MLEFTFRSPFYIFIKCAGLYSDEQLLGMFNLRPVNSTYKELASLRDHDTDNNIYLTQDECWVHLMDNFGYTMWNHNGIFDWIGIAALKHDIFWCDVGDTDRSYSFTYYQNRATRRCFRYDDYYNNKVIERDFGEPLENEGSISCPGKDELDRMLMIASSIGIDIDHTHKKIRSYQLSMDKYDF